MNLRTFGFAGVAVAMYAIPALAHHSFAMFDATKTFEVQGTVKEFLLVNPHSWLQVVSTDAKGKTTEWSFEMAAPNALTRDGWIPKSVVPGDKVTVTGHPLRDGSPAGQFLQVVLPNGQKLSHQYRDP